MYHDLFEAWGMEELYLQKAWSHDRSMVWPWYNNSKVLADSKHAILLIVKKKKKIGGSNPTSILL